MNGWVGSCLDGLSRYVSGGLSVVVWSRVSSFLGRLVAAVSGGDNPQSSVVSSDSSLKFRSNMTLPVRFLQRRQDPAAVHRRDRSSLGPHHHHGVVWPAADHFDLTGNRSSSPTGSIA